MWDFETDAEYQEQLDWVDQFVRDEIEPLPYVLTHALVRDDIWQALVPPLQEQVKARGLWATHLGPELGGPGHGQVKLALLNEILGRATMAPIVFGCQAPDSGNAEILAHFGTDEHKATYLQPLLDGQIWSCFSMTEPQAGADPQEFTCTAVLDGDEWVINGEKWFASNARYAEFIILMVITEPDNPSYQRHSMLIVPTDTPGVEIVRGVGHGGRHPRPGHPRVHALHRRTRARGQRARRARQRLRGGADPPRRRTHPSRDAHGRHVQARVRHDARACGVATHAGRAAVQEAARAGDDRRVVDRARTVPAARAADRLEDRPLPRLQASPR